MTSFVPLTVCGVSSRWLDVREGLVREGACISFVIACETFCLDTKLCYWVVSCSKNSSYAFLSAIRLLIVRKWAIIWQLMSFIMIKYHIYVWLNFPLKHYIHISIFMVSDIWRLEIMSGSLYSSVSMVNFKPIMHFPFIGKLFLMCSYQKHFV